MVTGMIKPASNVRCKAFAAAILIAGICPASLHAAAMLSGSFSGTAVNSQIYTPPFGNFDGSTITGTFSLDLTGCFVSTGPGPSTGGCSVAVASPLNAFVSGGLTAYGQPDTFVQVINTATTQRLSIVFGYMNPYTQADLELVGGVNAFLNGSEYSSLHVGEIDLSRSTLALRGGRSYGTGVALTSFAFDQAVDGVPEVSTWSMLLTGFAMTGLAVRRRKHQIACATQDIGGAVSLLAGPKPADVI